MEQSFESTFSFIFFYEFLGKEVRILVRNESTIPADFNGKVTIIKGDVLNKEDVERTLEGTDAVVITLGTRNKFNATTVMSEGTKNVVEAMKKSGLKKFSACMSSFLFRPADQIPPMVREIDADHRRMLEVIKESGLEYRAILPPHITAEPSRDFTTLYDKSPGRTISKFDLGKFFVDSLEVEEHSGKVIGIANVSLLT